MFEQDNAFLTRLNTESLASMISGAKQSVILASAGIQVEVADALVDCAERIGNESIILCLDVSEHAMRLGYGDVAAIKALKQSGLVIQHMPSLRFGLVVVDGNGFSFTPNALYLEGDGAHSAGFNALKLTEEQVGEVLIRLSPAARAIYTAQINSHFSESRNL